MTPLVKGLAVAAVHVVLVASLGAKLLYDRATLPRVWALTLPYDPDLPIRGRYVSMRLVAEPRGMGKSDESRMRIPVTLRAENGQLLAEAVPMERNISPDLLWVRFRERGDGKKVTLENSIPFFIPEHIPDPSRRPPDEELWVEVTVTKKGPPRPIRLGVKKGDGPIVPLEIG